MEQIFDGTVNAGRKGIAYDWQSLYVAAQAERVEHDLAEHRLAGVPG
jgi:hypothetical protein